VSALDAARDVRRETGAHCSSGPRARSVGKPKNPTGEHRRKNESKNNQGVLLFRFLRIFGFGLVVEK
jgi:hypothetical protein